MIPQSKTLNHSERYAVRQLVGPLICAACCPFETVQETAFKNHMQILEEFAAGVFTCPNATCMHLHIYDAEGILYCHTFGMPWITSLLYLSIMKVKHLLRRNTAALKYTKSVRLDTKSVLMLKVRGRPSCSVWIFYINI